MYLNRIYVKLFQYRTWESTKPDCLNNAYLLSYISLYDIYFILNKIMLLKLYNFISNMILSMIF